MDRCKVEFCPNCGSKNIVRRKSTGYAILIALIIFLFQSLGLRKHIIAFIVSMNGDIELNVKIFRT